MCRSHDEDLLGTIMGGGGDWPMLVLPSMCEHGIDFTKTCEDCHHARAMDLE
jgi:hypothetical protein